MESTGYPMASIEKTMRLLELLRVINEDAFLSENLTLKGGTAINIIHYSEIPRLSVFRFRPCQEYAQRGNACY